MPAAEVVRARIDAALKKNATAVLNKMGLSVSDAIRMLLIRVAEEKALPFDVHIPNRETQNAMLEGRDGKLEQFANSTDLLAGLNEYEEATSSKVG
ncbi:type II toxin-antitoxin system RelB/DinJ family antitoxin [Altererythrobacter confluentis]|uniref:Type II toxin-antitoxin system RelB/DinJ family antitoxin n=1 Tax=Allopontixanthobacter confluentis TaxID=1849021 RepID=A0A6L7GJC7_9SPHN|nr:type II toxin-antitoxin system RelB/DinJ family antitoxin [Allopontixanthobacter confluentis]MXP15685.1 type II toxin-antitoxin system RelB/DinJ family antitoxin [Allopontixanthobacter confluentis]